MTLLHALILLMLATVPAGAAGVVEIGADDFGANRPTGHHRQLQSATSSDTLSEVPTPAPPETSDSDALALDTPSPTTPPVSASSPGPAAHRPAPAICLLHLLYALCSVRVFILFYESLIAFGQPTSVSLDGMVVDGREVFPSSGKAATTASSRAMLGSKVTLDAPQQHRLTGHTSPPSLHKHRLLRPIRPTRPLRRNRQHQHP